ncbi:hypothetical protein C8R43DRAFT_1143119 [Mycena crocata]|nr:hypothetical protein C8R43DRAFT_1143119 [Mycena crocata]
MPKVFAHNPKLSNFIHDVPVDSAPVSARLRDQRATVRVMANADPDVSVERMAKIFGVRAEVVQRAITNAEDDSNHDIASEDEHEISNEFRAQYFSEHMQPDDVKIDYETSGLDEYRGDDGDDEDDDMQDQLDASDTDAKKNKSKSASHARKPRASRPRDPASFIFNPTAAEFKKRVRRPVKNYWKPMLDPRGRAISRIVCSHGWNFSCIGRTFGLKHGPIRKACLNQYVPADDLSDDYNLAGPAFAEAFPEVVDYINLDFNNPPPVQLASVNPSSVPHSSNPPPVQLATTARPAYRPWITRTAGSVRPRGTTVVSDSSDAEPPATRRKLTRKSADVGESSDDNTENGFDREPRRALSYEIDDVASNRERDSSASDAFFDFPASSPSASTRSRISPLFTPAPTAGPAASPSSHTVAPPHGLVTLSQLPVASGSSSACRREAGPEMDLTVCEFLRDVGRFDLSEWADKFTAVGITSMDQMRRMAGLPEERLIKTIRALFAEYSMTKVESLSIAYTMQDLVADTSYSSLAGFCS